MFVYSLTSKRKIVHQVDCGCARRIRQGHEGYFETLAEALEAGYRLCHHCAPLGKQYSKFKKDIQELSNKYPIQIKYQEDYLLVQDPIAKWIIVDGGEDGIFSVYHENYMDFKWSKTAAIPGHPKLNTYHWQDIQYGELDKILDAILNHMTGYPFFQGMSLDTIALVVKGHDFCFSRKPIPMSHKKRLKLRRKAKEKKKKKSVARVNMLLDLLAAEPNTGSRVWESL